MADIITNINVNAILKTLQKSPHCFRLNSILQVNILTSSILFVKACRYYISKHLSPVAVRNYCVRPKLNTTQVQVHLEIFHWLQLETSERVATIIKQVISIQSQNSKIV